METGEMPERHIKTDLLFEFVLSKLIKQNTEDSTTSGTVKFSINDFAIYCGIDNAEARKRLENIFDSQLSCTMKFANSSYFEMGNIILAHSLINRELEIDEKDRCLQISINPRIIKIIKKIVKEAENDK